MPELPEVQTVVNELSNCALNQKINAVHIVNPKVIKNITPKDFKSSLIGQKIKTITRVGKYLIFHLSNNKVIVSHLRMEGKYFYDKISDPYDKKHVLIRFVLNDKNELRYHDTRRFGTFNIYDEKNYLESSELKKLALDPLDKKFNGQYLFDNINKNNRYIKTTLLDQTKVSGIGNIYADEILFASKIHPQTLAKNITLQQAKLIAKNAKHILEWAIECNGTTIASYKFKKGHIGSFQEKLQVHTKVNKPCPRCKTIIKKMKVNGRGTYYCCKCQVL